METDEDSSNYYEKLQSIKKVLSHSNINYLKTKKNLIWNSLTLHLQKILQPGKLFSDITTIFNTTKVISVVLGTCLIAFAVYNIHIPSNITDGGGLGLILLLNHWFGLPPFIVAPALDILLYIIALRFLGKKFLSISILSSISLAIFFRVFASLPTILPDLSGLPVVAALMGGIFVGVGAGLVFRQGGSCGGDDALVITITKLTKWRLCIVYVIIDSAVLLLSMTYIAPSRIVFSLLTAITSSIFLDLTSSFRKKKDNQSDRKYIPQKSISPLS
jgi:uncharacterized membrane-anchored protein YitT (DUF2179 family)